MNRSVVAGAVMMLAMTGAAALIGVPFGPVLA